VHDDGELLRYTHTDARRHTPLPVRYAACVQCAPCGEGTVSTERLTWESGLAMAA